MKPSQSDHELAPYQREFVEFLIKSGALLFGEFTTKSGRKTPYFINTGRFDTGEKIAALGDFYASHIDVHVGTSFDVVFGPAYKGIPLCVTTAIALSRLQERDIPFCFDRKEVKDHGDIGKFVGRPISPDDNVVMVEDVITAGTTLREIVPFLRETVKASVTAVVIAVDRCERGTGTLSAVAEASEAHGIRVLPIVTIHQIVAHVSSENAGKHKVDAQVLGRIRSYLAEYGA